MQLAHGKHLYARDHSEPSLGNEKWSQLDFTGDTPCYGALTMFFHGIKSSRVTINLRMRYKCNGVKPLMMKSSPWYLWLNYIKNSVE